MPERASEPLFNTTTDRPRKIVVCHPDDFARINAAVMSLAYGDVLVQVSQAAEVGQAYVIDGSVFDA